MATNFPGSQDSFTNPSSSDTLDSPDHAGQHADANDAIEAIQGALLDGAPLHIDDTNERVGIGTTSPNYPLHVSGAVTLSASGSNDSGNSHFPFSDGRFYYTADPETGGTGDHVFRHYSGGSYVEQMRILENGNVGIGTTSPARTPLHVHRADTNAVELHMTNNESGSTSSDGLTIFYDDVSNGAGIWVREASPLRLATSGSERVRIDSSGNVGIGTTSPSSLLDLSSAFDTVDHNILIMRLRISYGLRDNVLSWMGSYLRDRTISFQSPFDSSRTSPVQSGVPQGSVLGPLLFVLYTADIIPLVLTQGLRVHMFADDIQIYGSCAPGQTSDLITLTSQCLDSAIAWSSSNRLLFNSSKSNFMWCALSRRKHGLP